MKYPINNTSVQIISINGINSILNATLSVNDRYETIIEIYDIPRDLINLSENNSFRYVIAKDNESENNFISVFDAHISRRTSSMQNDGTYSNTVMLRSTNAIIGNTPLSSEDTFQHFDLKVTDGCELIGLCPYDVNENYIDMTLNMKKVDIPINIRQIIAETSLGTWTFYAIPDHRFDRESLTLGLEQRIHFDSKTPLFFKEFHTMFERLIGFFEILCGELVTVNELTLHSGIYDNNHRSYEFIGYANYPLKKLRLLKGNGMDSTGFLRQAIFKLSDFENISTALDSWFDLIEKIPLANSAYQRILLDEDVKIITANKFLAAMQLVEGYASALSEKQDEIEKFQKHKSEIIEKIDSEDDKNFLDKYCNYSGETFRKLLRKFTFESITKLECLSSSQFNKNHNGLISKIKDERDIYTHSSTYCSPQFDAIELADIAVIYKYLYRINVLSKLGISSELICKRLSHSRIFTPYIKNFFDIDIKSPNNELSKFDSQMWHFSQV